MIVSFDFDDTLHIEGEPNESLVNALRAHHAKGHECIIVTARRPEHECPVWISKNLPGRVRIEEFVEKHKLPIKSCHFTSHKDKGPFLKKLDVRLHYDDQEEQRLSAEDCGVRAVDVNVVCDEWLESLFKDMERLWNNEF